MEHVVITYETIYEFLRSEKSKEELQKLTSSFFDDVSAYLAEKEKILLETEMKTDVFSQQESMKIRKQLDNVKMLLNDLYARRERKILDLALNIARTRSSIINASAVHEKEKPLFDEIIAVLERYRGSLLRALVTPKARVSVSSSTTHDSSVSISTVDTMSTANENPHEVLASSKKEVEFTADVDTFIDADLNEHGPFTPGQLASIPLEIAEILVGEGKAREV